MGIQIHLTYTWQQTACGNAVRVGTTHLERWLLVGPRPIVLQLCKLHMQTNKSQTQLRYYAAECLGRVITNPQQCLS